MTTTPSVSPSQKPPTQGTQPEAKDSQKLRPNRSGPIQFFKNLLFLAKATEQEIKEQAKVNVNCTIKDDKVMKELRNKFEDAMKNIKNEFKSDYNNARQEVGGLSRQIILISALVIAITFFGGSLLPDILSLDVLKAKIENLSEEIEDLEQKIEDLEK